MLNVKGFQCASSNIRVHSSSSNDGEDGEHLR